MPLTPDDLAYSAQSRCNCGAGLARIGDSSWDCSLVLLGQASHDDVTIDDDWDPETPPVPGSHTPPGLNADHLIRPEDPIGRRHRETTRP